MQTRIALECIYRIGSAYVCKIRAKKHARCRVCMPQATLGVYKRRDLISQKLLCGVQLRAFLRESQRRYNASPMV